MSKLKTILGQVNTTPLHFQLRRLRWMVFPAVLFLAAIHQFALYLFAEAFPVSWQWWVQLLIYAITGSLAAWLAMTWISDAVAQRYEAETQVRQAYAELEENHKQLLALHNLGERVSAADDQHAILEIAARAPLELTGARASTVVTFDESQDRLKLDMAWGLGETYLTILRTQLENGIPSGRCQNCNLLKTYIGSDCPLFQGLQAAALMDGIQSLICMPINHEDDRIGIISAYFPSAKGPPEDHIRLLNILAGVIATALENLRVRAREVETLHAIDRATKNSQIEDNKPFDDITHQVLKITAAGWDAQLGALFLFNDKSATLECAAQIGLDKSPQTFTLAQDEAERAYAQGEIIIQSGILPDNKLDVGSLAAAPLSTEGMTLGALFLAAKRQRAINENQTELLSTVAHQIALAIRNAQLYTQLGEMAVLQERNRLSREFHDGLAQTLGFLGFQAERVENLITMDQPLEAASEIKELRQTIRDAYADVREAIDGLRLSVDEPAQLADRLSEYAKAFSRQSRIQASISVSPEGLSVEPGTALQILRIAQEALTNVRKHANSKNVEIRLQDDSDNLCLIISDDGRGFPTEIQRDPLHHSYGLSTMRERAESLGGTLTIATNPNEGTCITVQVPIRELEAA